VRTQGRELGGGDDREVDVLRQVAGDAAETVDPHRAHRAGRGLGLPVHEVVDDQRAPRCREQLGEPHPPGLVAGVEVGRALDELVVLDDRPIRESPTQPGHRLAMAHEVDLRLAQLLASPVVLRRRVEPDLEHGVLPWRQAEAGNGLPSPVAQASRMLSR
jgi:hypothetical protein